MNARFKSIPHLRDEDRALLARVDAALTITADVSRADLLLVCRLSPARGQIVHHVMPKSISSHYGEEATGRHVSGQDQPLILQALNHGRGGRRQLEIVSGGGAPVIQEVYPILNDQQNVIAALVVETNMFAHERHRRRDPAFRQAVDWLQTMCLRGELPSAAELSRFGLYDGIYLVDRSRTINYMSGIAANLYRSIGMAVDMEGQRVAELEPVDEELVDQAFRTGECIERRDEAPDGRVWVRKALPLRKSLTWHWLRRRSHRWLSFPPGDGGVDAVMVLVHNATDAVQKQRELNVKSAIIQEVHHRVKNNLQTIAAILRIQARRAKSAEARQHLGDAVNRILSVAVIHEFLSEDEHQPINIRDLCQRIAYQVQQVAGNPDQEIDITIQGPNIRLPASQATPVAMVLNELVLNALEHGLAGHSAGRITIDLRDRGDQVQVAIRNTGTALPADFDAEHAASLGLQIVRTLVKDDLKGELTISAIPAELGDGHPGAVDGVPAPHGNGTPAADSPPVADSLPVADSQKAAMPEPGASQAPDQNVIRQGTQALVTFPKRSLRVD